MMHSYTCAYPTLIKAQSQLNQYKDISQVIKTLDDLPTTIKLKPGYISTMVSLYKYYNQDSQAVSYLKQQPTKTITRIQADLHFYNEDYKAASEIYYKLYQEMESMSSSSQSQQQENESTTILANLIICYSFIDVDQAEETVGLLPVLHEELDTNWSTLTGDQLENLDIPTIHKRRVVRKDNKTDSTKLSRKQALNKKKRARKRQVYLEKLQAEGKYNPDKPITPDQDRWLPKYMRTGRKYRQYHNNPKSNIGSQGTGTVSSKDMKKLDVAARVAASKDTGGKPKAASTAHMKISNSDAGKKKKGSRGGRRR